MTANENGFNRKVNIKGMTAEELKAYERERKAAQRAAKRNDEGYPVSASGTLQFHTAKGNAGVKAIPSVTVPLDVPEVTVWSPKAVAHAKTAWQRMAHALHFAPPTVDYPAERGPYVRVRLQMIPARPGVTSQADIDYTNKRNALQNAPSTLLVSVAEQLGIAVETAAPALPSGPVAKRLPSVRIALPKVPSLKAVERYVQNAITFVGIMKDDAHDIAYKRGTDASDAWQGRVLRYSPESPKWDGVTYCIRASGKRTIAPPRPFPPAQVFTRVEPPIDVTMRRKYLMSCQSSRIAPAINAYLDAIYQPSPDTAASIGATPVHRHGQWILSILPPAKRGQFAA